MGKIKKITLAFLISSYFVICLLIINLIFYSLTKTNENKSKTINNTTDNIPKEQQNKYEDSLKSFSNDLVVWGPGKQKNDLNQPVGPLILEENYKDYNCSFIDNTDEKKIYLTFDNGYENGYTTSILDTLREKNIKAVFFLTYDYVKDNVDLVKTMIQDGHKIGNHTYYHSSLPNVSSQKAVDNIQKQHDYVKENFGFEMDLFRFPMGEFSDRTLKLAEDMGYKTLFWSFAYKDWDEKKQIGPEKALNAVKNGLHPGAIYLLHSVSKDNAEILGDFIDYAIEQGYNFQLM
ncbi:MAG: polysaccharide deacetylase family protein [Oscillospiraceae bacterium]